MAEKIEIKPLDFMIPPGFFDGLGRRNAPPMSYVLFDVIGGASVGRAGTMIALKINDPMLPEYKDFQTTTILNWPEEGDADNVSRGKRGSWLDLFAACGYTDEQIAQANTGGAGANWIQGMSVSCRFRPSDADTWDTVEFMGRVAFDAARAAGKLPTDADFGYIRKKAPQAPTEAPTTGSAPAPQQPAVHQAAPPVQPPVVAQVPRSGAAAMGAVAGPPTQQGGQQAIPTGNPPVPAPPPVNRPGASPAPMPPPPRPR